MCEGSFEISSKKILKEQLTGVYNDIFVDVLSKFTDIELMALSTDHQIIKSYVLTAALFIILMKF